MVKCKTFKESVRFLGIYKRHGFTLMEIIVVIVIIGAVASAALVSYSKVMLREKERAAYQNLMEVGSLFEMYRIKYGKYPICTGAPSGTWCDLSTDLGAPIDEGVFDVSCATLNSGDSYACWARYPDSSNVINGCDAGVTYNFELRIHSESSGGPGPNNPFCTLGTPTVLCLANACPTCTTTGCPNYN